MDYLTTSEGEDVTLTIDYRLASQIEDNGSTTWYVDWFTVVAVDGVNLSEKDRGDWTDWVQSEAEDIENAIMEEEA